MLGERTTAPPLRPLRALASLALLGAIAAVGSACSAAPADEGDTTESGLRTLAADEKIGSIAFGETRTVSYSETPLYRALEVDAEAGDTVDAWVRSADADAKVWLLGADYRTLAASDDADATTLDAHVVHTVRSAGVYYLVMREKNRESTTFHVSLAARGPVDGGASDADAGPDSGTDASDASTTTSLFGFTSDQRVAARGSGTSTQNIGPSYQCHRKTTTSLPCGGWVSLSNTSGATRVTLGVMGHYAYYDNVSGHPDIPFPPPASNRFWNQSAVVELDAHGHGHLDRVNDDTQGYPQSTATYDVDAIDGVVTVAMSTSLWPASCNSYDETCTIRVLSP